MVEIRRKSAISILLNHPFLSKQQEQDMPPLTETPVPLAVGD
jgi:hypothetical protein